MPLNTSFQSQSKLKQIYALRLGSDEKAVTFKTEDWTGCREGVIGSEVEQRRVIEKP